MSRKKVGQAPGTIEYTGRIKTPTKISVMDYTKEYVDQKQFSAVGDLAAYLKTKSTSWINIIGLSDINKMKEIGNLFEIPPLLLEDILDVNQRPKIDMYGKNIIIVMKVIYEKNSRLVFEHVSIIINPKFVLTFQETPTDVFQPVVDRITGTNWRIRELGTAYLGYALLDAIVDYYFTTLDEAGQHLDTIEQKVLMNKEQNVLPSIYRLKRDLILLRKTIWPLREIISKLQKSELISKPIMPFIDDVYDHTVEIIETIETYREVSSSILETHLTHTNNRMNEIMKVLTVISTIFIPLTFITGVYGMNFSHMPEIPWKYSYLIVWIVMLGIGITMVTYFRRKGWF